MKIYEKIKELSIKYSNELKNKTELRIEEMNDDDNSHYLIYRVLGITTKEGQQIDLYQNKGRFLYKYAGSFLEEVAILCFKEKYVNVQEKVKIQNNFDSRPKTFEIDCLINNMAYEIKWRDATTDGDHISKEHTRIKAIKDNGYIPIRIMFYYPNRSQAKRIQETIETLYNGIGGEYYYADSAWQYIKDNTNIDLLNILKEIALEKERG